MRDVICLRGAYHGVTTASDEVSTTLNDNPRYANETAEILHLINSLHLFLPLRSLETRAPWIHLVPMPNLYRGEFRIDLTNRLSEDEAVIDRIAAQYAGE